MSTEVLILKEKEVSRRIDALGLEEESSVALKEKFLPFVIEAEKWRAQADAIVITQEGEKDKMKEARETRLALRGIRVNLEKERKALKKESLAKGQAIDLIAGTLRTLIEPIEDDLDLKERYDEIRAEERREIIGQNRAYELMKYQLTSYPFNLREASEEDYQSLLANLEAVRLKKIAEDEERERLRLEEVNRQAEVTRKKELASMRSKMMLESGYQYTGIDLGEISLDEFTALLDEKKKEKEEKIRLNSLKKKIEDWFDDCVNRISVASVQDMLLLTIELTALSNSSENNYEVHSEYYSEKLIKLMNLVSEKNLRIAEDLRLAQEKKQLIVENIELQQQVPEIIVEKKVTTPAPVVREVARPHVKEALAPIIPSGPTPEQLTADKLKILTMAGMISGIKMPEVETAQAKSILAGTATLIEKIRVYLVEKSTTLK